MELDITASDINLDIARLIGEPINIQQPVAVQLTDIADVFTAEAGEHMWRLKDLDKTSDVVLNVTPDGIIKPVKRTPMQDVLLSFEGLNSPLDYVHVNDVLNSVDTTALARRKEAITRGMDKRELKMIIDALFTPTASIFPSNEVGGYVVTPTSGDDIYDVFMKAKHGIEDYGDQYSALVGSTVKERIDTYDKDHATAFQYKVTANGGLKASLQSLDITVRKVFGKLATTTTGSEVLLMDKKKLILVARDSSIADGKPIQFVRRNISAQMAASMGGTTDNAQRIVLVGQTPQTINVAGETNLVLAYSIYGYESIVMAVKNPMAIATADLSAILI